MSYFKALCLAAFLALTGCGGGGGNPGTCNGGPDVCGRNSSGTGSTTTPVATLGCSNAVLNAGDLCTVYSVSGTAVQAALTYTSGGETLQEKVTLPWSKEMLSKPDSFLYISAQNQQSTGAVSVFINVNGRLLDSNRSTEAFGIATASGTFPPVAITPNGALVKSVNCIDMRSLSEALAYLAAGSAQLDANKDGKPCEDKFPGQ